MGKDNLGVPPSGSGHSAEPEPKVSAVPASVLNAGGLCRRPIVGRFHDWTSKCGVRFLEFESDRPYAHSFFVEVTSDNENDSDDDLNDALLDYLDKTVLVVCDVAESGELFATPSRFSLASCDTHAKRGDAKQGSVSDG